MPLKKGENSNVWNTIWTRTIRGNLSMTSPMESPLKIDLKNHILFDSLCNEKVINFLSEERDFFCKILVNKVKKNNKKNKRFFYTESLPTKFFQFFARKKDK